MPSRLSDLKLATNINQLHPAGLELLTLRELANDLFRGMSASCHDDSFLARPRMDEPTEPHNPRTGIRGSAQMIVTLAA
jgi:hypothetical protein